MADVNTPISLADLQLAQRALKDPKAEEELLRRIYPRIFQVARSALGTHRQAEDAAQMAAIEVVKSLENYSGAGSIEAWAGRIAYRVAMRSLRKERDREKNLYRLSDEDQPKSDSPEKSVSRRQLFELLSTKMEKIPDKRRTSLILHLAYGYTVSEVAELTSASPNTVKDRLKAAYRDLRTIFDEHPNLRAAMMEELA